MKSTPKAAPAPCGANQSVSWANQFVSWPFQEPPVPAWAAGMGTAVLNHGKVVWGGRERFSLDLIRGFLSREDVGTGLPLDR